MSAPLRAISSMATRQVLAALAEDFRARAGIRVEIESVGGVEAARRVQAGEAFDVVLLASDAIDALIKSARVQAHSRTDFVRSGVAVAVRSGAPRPDLRSASTVREAVRDAPSVGISTGPSGAALQRLFNAWGLSDSLGSRLVVAPPGVPVGALVASGDVALGFQQLSELIHVAGIEIVGPLPPDIQITTTFTGGICASTGQAAAAQAWLEFLRSPGASEAKRREGMDPA